MFELVNQKRNNLRKNKKGFTLVEIIVVLVILAILAAILVPTMIGWINKANQKTAVVEARSVVLATQAIVSENYATLGTGDNTYDAAALLADPWDEVATLAEFEGSSEVTALTTTAGRVATFTYVDSTGGYTVTYDATATGDGKYTVTETP